MKQALGTAQHTLAMEQMDNYYFGLKDANVKNLKKLNDNVPKSIKCNQCDFVSSQAGNLRTHWKTHIGEKQYKCNQCDYTSSYTSTLRRHLKMHNGEKSNKCTQCDFVSSYSSALMIHLKTHSGESQINATNVTLHLLRQAI